MRNIFRQVFDATTIRVMIVVSLVAFAYPIAFSHLKLGHSPYGIAGSTILIYVLPTLIAALLASRVHTRLLSSVRSSDRFFLTWVASVILISNSLCSPFVVDVLMFAFFGHGCVRGVFDHESVAKMVASYWLVFKHVAFYSLPAALASYSLFQASYAVFPLSGHSVALAWLKGRVSACAAGLRPAHPLALTCLLLLFCLSGQSTHRASVETYNEFRQVDRDGNGFIDWAEYRNWAEQSLRVDEAGAAAEFQRIDVDHRLKIDFFEWSLYMRAGPNRTRST